MHLTVHALLKGLSGSAKADTPSPPRPQGEGGDTPGSMEALASILGPPQGKFVPPCRML